MLEKPGRKPKTEKNIPSPEIPEIAGGKRARGRPRPPFSPVIALVFFLLLSSWCNFSILPGFFWLIAGLTGYSDNVIDKYLIMFESVSISSTYFLSIVFIASSYRTSSDPSSDWFDYKPYFTFTEKLVRQLSINVYLFLLFFVVCYFFLIAIVYYTYGSSGPLFQITAQLLTAILHQDISILYDLGGFIFPFSFMRIIMLMGCYAGSWMITIKTPLSLILMPIRINVWKITNCQ